MEHKLTEEEILKQSMEINLQDDLEHERLCSRYAGMDVDEICEIDALDEDEDGQDIVDEFEDDYDENEDQSDVPEDEDHEKYFAENKADLKYYTFFRRYSDWPEQLDKYVHDFKKRNGVFPNVVLMNRLTYSKMEDAFDLIFSKDMEYEEKEKLGIKLGIYRAENELEDDSFYYEKGSYFSNEDYRLLMLERTDFGSGVLELIRTHGELAEDPDFNDDCKVSVRNKTAIPFPIIDVEATSKNIRKIMEEEGVSQVLLTRIFNVSKQAVSGWVTGKALPNLDNLTVLSRILNRPLEAIIVTRDR